MVRPSNSCGRVAACGRGAGGTPLALLLVLLLATLVVGCDSGAVFADKTQATATSRDGVSRHFTQYQGGQAVVRGTPLQFPRDHGPHPQQSVEWWYVTANLTASTGATFGAQWTLFRARLPSAAATADNPWWQGQLYFAHFALQGEDSHHAFERFGRAGQVVLTSAPFRASLDDWALYSRLDSDSATASNGTLLPLVLAAQSDPAEPGFGIQLLLDDSPIIAHGDAGYSQKTPAGHASYYYSLPFLRASGEIVFAGEVLQVTGSAWLDREWSGGLLSDDFSGWDWFSAQANDGQTAIMAFCLRDQQQGYRFCDATRMGKNGATQVIARDAITLEATATVDLDGAEFPIRWQLQLQQDTFVIEAVNPDSRNQLTFPYWEGRVTFYESPTAQRAKSSWGQGYAELTGY